MGCAAACNKLLCVCELLAHGCDVNAVDNQGHGALYLAASAGYLDIVQLLVQAKANTELQDVRGVTPLEWAQRFKHECVVDFLVEQVEQGKEHPPPKQQDDGGYGGGGVIADDDE